MLSVRILGRRDLLNFKRYKVLIFNLFDLEFSHPPCFICTDASGLAKTIIHLLSVEYTLLESFFTRSMYSIMFTIVFQDLTLLKHKSHESLNKIYSLSIDFPTNHRYL